MPQTFRIFHTIQFDKPVADQGNIFGVYVQGLRKTKKIKPKEECIPVGCVPSAAVAVGGRGGETGVCLGGCLPRGVVSAGEGCPLGGGGSCLPRSVQNVDRLTDVYENITFPQLLLRTLKIPTKI